MTAFYFRILAGKQPLLGESLPDLKPYLWTIPRQYVAIDSAETTPILPEYYFKSIDLFRQKSHYLCTFSIFV